MKKKSRFLALLLTIVLALSATFVGCGPTDEKLNDLIKPQRDYFGF